MLFFFTFTFIKLSQSHFQDFFFFLFVNLFIVIAFFLLVLFKLVESITSASNFFHLFMNDCDSSTSFFTLKRTRVWMGVAPPI